MYHSLMLVDMSRHAEFDKSISVSKLSQISTLLEEYIPKMLMYQDSMAHPDGGLSFFNDSVDGIAPSVFKIKNYAKKMGFLKNTSNSSDPELGDNIGSGYFSAKIGKNKLIFDAASIGPDYIPGHAHAVHYLLNFLLVVNEFCKLGDLRIWLSLKRLGQRKTFSHNTVEVDCKDSSQVWSSFRVANRARIFDRFAALNADNVIILNASHDGYKTIFGGCNHTRRLTFSTGALLLNGLSIQGRFNSAKSRFIFSS